MGNKCKPVIIVRFLGTTPDSSSIYPLLKSICSQICHNYQKPSDNIPLELSNLTNYFKKLLECATVEKPLFIFSLDHFLHQTNTRATLTLKFVKILTLYTHFDFIMARLIKNNELYTSQSSN